MSRPLLQKRAMKFFPSQFEKWHRQKKNTWKLPQQRELRGAISYGDGITFSELNWLFKPWRAHKHIPITESKRLAIHRKESSRSVRRLGNCKKNWFIDRAGGHFTSFHFLIAFLRFNTVVKNGPFPREERLWRESLNPTVCRARLAARKSQSINCQTSFFR